MATYAGLSLASAGQGYKRFTQRGSITAVYEGQLLAQSV